MKGLTPLSNWNYLRDNHKLHGVISHRLDERKLSVAFVEQALKLPVYKFQRYLDNNTPNLTNHELMQVLQFLGIEIGLEIELK